MRDMNISQLIEVMFLIIKQGDKLMPHNIFLLISKIVIIPHKHILLLTVMPLIQDIRDIRDTLLHMEDTVISIYDFILF
jgi:hypothetical protein